MTIFTTLLLKITPLYLTMLLGFVAGRLLEVRGESIARLIFYIMVPGVVFYVTTNTHIDLEAISLPVLIFAISSAMCLMTLHYCRKLWKDSRANVQALMAGTANTGYFGLPVAIILFDENTVGLYVIAFMGMTIFEMTIGFFVTAKGKHTVNESLMKVVKLPSIYAFIAGIILSTNQIAIPEFLDDFFHNIQGTYVILGLMMTGLALADNRELVFDRLFVSISLMIKFIFRPLVALVIITLDRLFIQFYTTEIHAVLMLIAIMPHAANSVVIASILKAHPEQVSTTVVISTLIALLYVPLMAALFEYMF